MDAEEAVRTDGPAVRRLPQKENLKVYYSLRALNSCSNRLV